MDTVTQIVLGASIGQAVLGRKVGYRAALWGGACAALPDLDLLVSLGGDVEDFTYHRSFSHSLLVLLIITPILTWLILKIHPQTADSRGKWSWLVFLALTTHPLLDSFTVYGTQLLWPLITTPVGFGSIFIIDPLYTLPIVVGLILALSLTKRSELGQRCNIAGLLLSCLYLFWTLGAQYHVQRVAAESLSAIGKQEEPMLITPTPFNTVLWRIVSMNDIGYREGFYSLLDNHRTVNFTQHHSEKTLLRGLNNNWPVQRLQWFTKGFYKVENLNGAVVLSDLRMGVEPDYAFRFKIGEIGNPHQKPVLGQRLESIRDWSRLPGLLERIWSGPRQHSP